MKRIISIILTLVLSMSMTVTVFADTATNTGGNTSISVKGVYVAGAGATDVVSVGIAWGAMQFTYTDNSKFWDVTDHNTKNNADANWAADDNYITVTNHSNVGIKANFTYTKSVTTVNGKFYDAVSGGNEKKSISLVRAAEGSATDSVKGTVYFNVTADSTITSTDNGSTLGTITVKIARQ